MNDSKKNLLKIFITITFSAVFLSLMTRIDKYLDENSLQFVCNKYCDKQIKFSNRHVLGINLSLKIVGLYQFWGFDPQSRNPGYGNVHKTINYSKNFNYF
jgi:hypothetical protein